MMSKVKQTILSVSIAIILALFVGYGISTFYESPKYEDFCTDTYRDSSYINTSEECESQGGIWNDMSNNPKPMIEAPGATPAYYMTGFCDLYKKCNDDFQAASTSYNRLVFIIASIAGLTAVLIGSFLLKIESVSSGIMGGGILSLLYGVVRYWSDASDTLRFVMLGIALAVLIWVGYRKFATNQ